MSRKSIHAIFGALLLTLTSGATFADTAAAPSTEPSYYLSSGATLNGTTQGIATAESRAAEAKAQYDQAYTNLQQAVADARHDQAGSPDLKTAQSELMDAQKQFEATFQTVQANLASDAVYKELTASRADIETKIKSTSLASSARIDLATRKMQIAAAINSMETKALSEDPAAQNAQKRLMAARESMRRLIDKLEGGVASDPRVTAAKTNLENATIARAAAVAYLKGAYIDRASAIAEAQQGYGKVVQYSNPYDQNINPYYGGYYPYSYFGYPYYPSYTVILGGGTTGGDMHHHGNDHDSDDAPVIGPGGGNLSGIGNLH